MSVNPHRLILASASERRSRLLSELGVNFDIVVPDVEESACSRSAHATVLTNAELKNVKVLDLHPECAVISADTAIEFHGELIGKPIDFDAARAQLMQFSGQTHTVLTGIVFSIPGTSPIKKVDSSRVVFRKLDESVITRYFQMVNPLDKAGAYDIGSHGDLIVDSYTGSLTNIIGLPMEIVTPLLQENGYLQ